MKIIDRLAKKVFETQNPTVMGLDPKFDYLPKKLQALSEVGDINKQGAKAIFEFNKGLIDGLCDIIPAVKIQVAYYEMYGLFGMETFLNTIDYAKKAGMVVMADVKRGDIGATAEAYSKAYLGSTDILGKAAQNFDCDMVTVNPYFGIDGINPFLDDCAAHDKGMFILVKTSNASGGEFQDLICEGKPLYEHVAAKVDEWGKNLIGDCGYSSVGAVVGATYKEQGIKLRQQFPNLYFLVPGYGAQGAKGEDLAGCFDKKGGGAIVNASRSIMCAYKKRAGMHYVDAARKEALAMKADILNAIGGIHE